MEIRLEILNGEGRVRERKRGRNRSFESFRTISDGFTMIIIIILGSRYLEKSFLNCLNFSQGFHGEE